MLALPGRSSWPIVPRREASRGATRLLRMHRCVRLRDDDDEGHAARQSGFMVRDRERKGEATHLSVSLKCCTIWLLEASILGSQTARAPSDKMVALRAKVQGVSECDAVQSFLPAASARGEEEPGSGLTRRPPSSSCPRSSPRPERKVAPRLPSDPCSPAEAARRALGRSPCSSSARRAPPSGSSGRGRAASSPGPATTSGRCGRPASSPGRSSRATPSWR